MLALGSNDFSISIWRNILHKPIVVLKEVFGRNLMDLCWYDPSNVTTLIVGRKTVYTCMAARKMAPYAQ